MPRSAISNGTAAMAYGRPWCRFIADPDLISVVGGELATAERRRTPYLWQVLSKLMQELPQGLLFAELQFG